MSSSDSFALSLTRSSPVGTHSNVSLRKNLSASLGYHRSAAALPSVFPRLGGDSATALGVAGVSRDAFDSGLPSIQLTEFAGLSDITPSLRNDRQLNFADSLLWTSGKHSLRWGGEFRRVEFDLRRSPAANGSFTFTGFATAETVNGTTVILNSWPMPPQHARDGHFC